MSKGDNLELFEECENLWKQIQQSSDELEKVAKPCPLRQHNDELDDGISVNVLKTKVQRLEAEIKDLSVTTPSFLPHCPKIQYEALEEELCCSIAQLSEVLTLISTQKKEMMEQQKREEQYNSELKDVIASLHEANQKLSTQGSDPNSKNMYCEELSKKITSAETYNKDLAQKLNDFVDEHFPLPTEQIFSEVKKKLRSSDRKMTLADTLSIKTILKDLMKECIKDPSSYTQIDHRYWPPYVELLLRCHIAERHPTDERMIKLVPFHL